MWRKSGGAPEWGGGLHICCVGSSVLLELLHPLVTPRFSRSRRRRVLNGRHASDRDDAAGAVRVCEIDREIELRLRRMFALLPVLMTIQRRGEEGAQHTQHSRHMFTPAGQHQWKQKGGHLPKSRKSHLENNCAGCVRVVKREMVVGWCNRLHRCLHKKWFLQHINCITHSIRYGGIFGKVGSTPGEISIMQYSSDSILNREQVFFKQKTIFY